MPLGRRTRTVTIWLLCAALAASALLPALSHALVRVAGIDGIEICTSTGIARPAAVDARNEGPRELPSDDGARSAGACAWCLAHAACVALPPSERIPNGFFPPATDALVGIRLDSLPRAHFVPDARPRAPPR